MHHTFDKKRHTINLFTYLAFIVMICSVGLILSGVVGYRYGITDLKTSLLVLTKYGVYGCILAIIFSFMAFGSVMRKDVNIISLFLILFTLSPGFILSGEYPKKKSLFNLSLNFFSKYFVASCSVNPV